MQQILLAYGLPKETIAPITILYRNTKMKVRSADGDTEYVNIVAGVLQGDTLAPYLFIMCLDYVLRCIHIYIHIYLRTCAGAIRVTFIIIGNGKGDPSSNSGGGFSLVSLFNGILTFVV